MSRAARIVFLALVAATFAAFFVAQRLKNSPSMIQQLGLQSRLSPNQDGRFERARLTFKLKEADDVTVAVLDADGDEVRTLLDDRHVEAYTPIKPSLAWDGRDDAGRLVPDGRYRVRLTLQHKGRSVVLPRSIVKDTTPPRPRVLSIGPASGPGAEILPRPEGGPATVRFSAAGRRPRVRVFRTAPGRLRLVLERALRQGDTTFAWDGRSPDGRRLSPGTYLVVAEWRDALGNVGSSVRLDRRGLPVLGRGRLPGRGGVTIRYLAAQPPVEPVKARDPVTVCIDARQRRYTWALRRVGAPRPRKRGRGTRPCVTTRAPGGVSGAYLFEVRTRRHATRVPLAVQARRPVAGTARQPRGVLVVLPALTWQGRNPVDDDGDGAPNLLDRGTSTRLVRVYARDGLPEGFARNEAPLLGWLDRTGRRYDVTTDYALAAGRGPRLAGHRGVLLAGDVRWVPERLRTQLRSFARRGGTVVSLGTDALRRGVRLDRSRRGPLARPARTRATDVFGFRLRRVTRGPVTLTNRDDTIELFAETGGQFGPFDAVERIASSTEADPVATAVTPDGAEVLVAARYGRGLAVHFGVPELATHLTPDPAVAALMARTWTLLSR